MEIEEISDEEFESYQNNRKATWKQVASQVRKNGKPLKISELTRGQVAAGYRALKQEGLLVKANYKDGFLLVSP